MFQFEHVFWLRGSSPCFLRDLDAGVLAEAVLEADEHARADGGGRSSAPYR